jgi:hypothetical protein
MNLYATFQQSIEIEQALAELENSFVPTDQIVIIYLENEPAQVQPTARTKKFIQIHLKLAWRVPPEVLYLGPVSGLF